MEVISFFFFVMLLEIFFRKELEFIFDREEEIEVLGGFCFKEIELCIIIVIIFLFLEDS